MSGSRQPRSSAAVDGSQRGQLGEVALGEAGQGSFRCDQTSSTGLSSWACGGSWKTVSQSRAVTSSLIARLTWVFRLSQLCARPGYVAGGGTVPWWRATGSAVPPGRRVTEPAPDHVDLDPGLEKVDGLAYLYSIRKVPGRGVPGK
jgi:hypothetical protein